jgi:hypothetical protein
LKQRRIRRALQELRHTLKLDQRFVVDNAAVELHKYSAKLVHQVQVLQVNLTT